jgi:hypothetical protein
MTNIPNRKERRKVMKFQGILKMKSKLPHNKWLNLIRESIKNGKQFFFINQDTIEKSLAEKAEAKELAMIEKWKDFGYNTDEIEKLREAHAIFSIKYSTTWHADKRIARRLIKEVNKSKTERING